MPKIWLSPRSEKALASFAAHPRHALLLQGREGVGLKTIATLTASQISSEPPSIVSPDGASISIDSIRQLYTQTRSTRPGAYVVIVDDADTMGQDAQNAFLKLLEEPPRNVHFILTTHRPQKLLTTIRSRVVSIDISPLTSKQTQDFLAEQKVADPALLQKLVFLADGYPAMLHRLASDTPSLDGATKTMTDAKKFLQSSTYERLCMVSRLPSDRHEILKFLGYVARLVEHSGRSSFSPAHARAIDSILETSGAIVANGNVKLQLTALATSLVL